MPDRILDEEQVKREKLKVSKFADKNQRLAWRRKQARINELIERLEPYQQKRLELITEMQPILDQIQAVRDKMVDDCVHPIDELVHTGVHVKCKFCNTKLQVK